MSSGTKKRLPTLRTPCVPGASGLRWLPFLTIVWIALLPRAVMGQIYSCKDAAGRTISSDRLMPKCADRATREFSNTGILKSEISAPLNAEQKRQLQVQEEKRHTANILLEEERQQGRALLARYRSENDIATSRQYYLTLSKDTIKRDQEWILDAERQLKEAQAETEFYKNKKLPSALKKRLNDAQTAINDARPDMIEHQNEIGGINTKFDAMLARYRVLRGNALSATSR
ncbi:hypothetical protein [Glaciimonas immobilis]|uniref:DUF4124 domain-containing protein n=1 Tax=Glaciimonas immobilis TaxID=728004 RepID=A0A840RSX3_9BURK|nr:hypothetical protein [Glaciimonas immobilis]KAF3997184.1 hypothetical protein HAV38_16115 [Glaciimonas immobilis]MBB5200056.1 hypothetical protein [Glaciimonas immobilis]